MTCLTLSSVGSAGWSALALSLSHNAAALAGPFQSGIKILAGFFSGMTEPVRLVLMGIGLIALSVVVRRRKR